MRDKLIELIGDAPYGLRTLGQAADELISVESIADFLISHGVTFADDTNVGTKPMTNGDRIRAMTDEELADIICCPIDGDTGLCLGIYDCLACCLKWLKQPAEVE